MTDAQMQSDTIDDAIRTAEQQLERRIEELRSIAAAKSDTEPATPAPAPAAPESDAVLRPVRRQQRPEAPVTPEPVVEPQVERESDAAELPTDLMRMVRKSPPLQPLQPQPRGEAPRSDAAGRIPDNSTRQAFKKLSSELKHQQRLMSEVHLSLNNVSSQLDANRLQNTHDLEQVVDSLTGGWQSLFKAMGTMVKRFDQLDDRLATIESTVQSKLETLDRHVTELPTHKSFSTLATSLTTGVEALQQELTTMQASIESLPSGRRLGALEAALQGKLDLIDKRVNDAPTNTSFTTLAGSVANSLESLRDQFKYEIAAIQRNLASMEPVTITVSHPDARVNNLVAVESRARDEQDELEFEQEFEPEHQTE